jgi:CheY-like chemotaxis protein
VADRCLAGRLILVVEDEPLVALDVEKALRAAGARVVSAGYVESGLYTTEHPELSAAVVDLRLGTGNGAAVCRRLRQLGVPFVVHTGYPAVLVTSDWPDVPVISKPADASRIVRELARLLPPAG